jgi:hypothetical protein
MSHGDKWRADIIRGDRDRLGRKIRRRPRTSIEEENRAVEAALETWFRNDMNNDETRMRDAIAAYRFALASGEATDEINHLKYERQEIIDNALEERTALEAQTAELAAALEEAVETITPPWNEQKEAAVKRARAALARSRT